jgi:multiple sugar transport system permease protein
LQKLFNNRHFLGLLFMLPAGVLLLVFLTYPLGLGTWLGFTDAKIGRSGQWVGLDNFKYLVGDTSRGSRSSTRSSTRWSRASSSSRWACGSPAAQSQPAVQVVLPRHRAAAVHRAHGAFRASPSGGSTTRSSRSCPGRSLKMGLINQYIDFLGDPWNARLSLIAANIWRGVPFVAICLLAGLQTISPSLYEAAALDGATPWQRFRLRDAAAPHADHRRW